MKRLEAVQTRALGQITDNSEPPIDTKLVNHLNPSNSTHLNEVNNEAFDLKTYKKFLSFLKFQEMTEKYDT